MPTSSVESEHLVDACFNKTLSNCLLKTVSLKNRYKKIYIHVKKKCKIYCADTISTLRMVRSAS